MTPAFLASAIASIVPWPTSVTAPAVAPRLILIESAPNLTASSIALTYKNVLVFAPPCLSENTLMKINCDSGATPATYSLFGAFFVGLPTEVPTTCIPWDLSFFSFKLLSQS